MLKEYQVDPRAQCVQLHRRSNKEEKATNSNTNIDPRAKTPVCKPEHKLNFSQLKQNQPIISTKKEKFILKSKMKYKMSFNHR